MIAPGAPGASYAPSSPAASVCHHPSVRIRGTGWATAGLWAWLNAVTAIRQRTHSLRTSRWPVPIASVLRRRAIRTLGWRGAGSAAARGSAGLISIRTFEESARRWYASTSTAASAGHTACADFRSTVAPIPAAGTRASNASSTAWRTASSARSSAEISPARCAPSSDAARGPFATTGLAASAEPGVATAGNHHQAAQGQRHQAQ